MFCLSYTRDDGKSFRYDCRVDDRQVRTRMIDEAGPGTGAPFIDPCDVPRILCHAKRVSPAGRSPQTLTTKSAAVGSRWKKVDSFKQYNIPMNKVVVGLDAGLEKDVRLVRTVAERFGPATAKHYKVAKFADLPFPSDDELAAMRQAPNTAP